MRCIHVLNRSPQKIVESTIEYFSRHNQNIEPCADYSPDSSHQILGVFALVPQWVSIRESLKLPCDLTAHYAHLLQTFAIVITLDEPIAWGFSAYYENECLGTYKWELPSGFLERRQEQLQYFETERLRQLGVKGLDTIKARRLPRQEAMDISDPYLEQHYRVKVSNGKMNLEPPDLQPELARSLHKLTGMSTAARIRKILSTPHINIGGAVTEFNQALGLANWMDDCALDSIGPLLKRGAGFLYRLIEK